MIPIRTAVSLRGDFWTLGLNAHDPRGHQTVLQEDPHFREWQVSRRYRWLRGLGYSVSQTVEKLGGVT